MAKKIEVEYDALDTRNYEHYHSGASSSSAGGAGGIYMYNGLTTNINLVSSNTMIPGFMIGAHGMTGCGQSGFLYIDSIAPGSSSSSKDVGDGAEDSADIVEKLKFHYFEEFNSSNKPSSSSERYDAILACVKSPNTTDLSQCTHLATTWFELELKADGGWSSTAVPALAGTESTIYA